MIICYLCFLSPTHHLPKVSKSDSHYSLVWLDYIIDCVSLSPLWGGSSKKGSGSNPPDSPGTWHQVRHIVSQVLYTSRSCRSISGFVVFLMLFVQSINPNPNHFPMATPEFLSGCLGGEPGSGLSHVWAALLQVDGTAMSAWGAWDCICNGKESALLGLFVHEVTSGWEGRDYRWAYSQFPLKSPDLRAF
jgi:hypothetical protein